MLPYSSSQKPARSAGPSRSTVQSEPPQKPLHRRAAFIIAATLGLVVIAGAAFAVYYLFFRTPVPNVDLQIQTPDKVLLGEPFTLTVTYGNTSEQSLKNASVAVSLPAGVSFIGTDPSARVGQQSVGELSSQSIGSRDFKLIITDGETESVKRVAVSFRYALTDSQQALFENNVGADISVGASAVPLSFNVPQNVFPGQSFDMGLAYQNNSRTTFEDIKLIFNYPQTFQFESATTTPSSGNDQWDLGVLAPNDSGEVVVTGSMNGSAGSFFAVGAHLQVQIEGRTYDLGVQEARIGISSAPLSLTITANRDPAYVATLGGTIPYILEYRNNSAFTLQNVVIQADLEGEMFDVSSVRSVADLDSVRNTLTWNTSNTSGLSTLDPGESGSVQFVIGLRNAWPIQEASDKNFAVRVNAGIRSLSVPAGISADQTASAAELITKIAGQAAIATTVYFEEPEAGAENEGPYPPRVDQPTQYTVHWQIRNYSTDITNVRVAAILQSGARLVRVIRSTAASSPVYNSQTGQVVWDISSIPATRGVLSAPVEAIFQIEAIPASNQVGLDVPLIGQTTLTATDAFTGKEIQQTSPAKNSSLPDDPRAATGDRRVQP